jgi:hypothetical protein
MKKKALIFISIVIVILLSIFVVFKYGNTIINHAFNKEDKIQLWYYYAYDDKYELDEFADDIKDFCEINNISLEIFKYGYDMMSYDDYALKSSIAAATGNFISIGRLRPFNNFLIKNAADYSKLENYNKLFDIYKGRSCIPLRLVYMSYVINGKAINYYGIDTSNTPVITYIDYLKLKQEMKDKGARFKFNNTECREIVDYYLNKNGLLFIDEKSENIVDKNKFKEMLKQTILEICNDIILYNDGILHDNYEGVNTFYSKLPQIYDENSKLYLVEEFESSPFLISPIIAERIDNVSDKMFMISPYFTSTTGFYMNKKITNKKIYDVANYIVNESRYFEAIGNGSISEMVYIPVFNTEEARNKLKVDENWEYSGKIGSTKNSGGNIKKIINTSYDILVKDREKAEEVAKYLYDPISSPLYDVYEISVKVVKFTEAIIFEVAKELSGEKNSLKNFDSEDANINKMIEDKINEFLDKYYLYNH